VTLARPAATAPRLDPDRYSAAQRRVVAAALDLFADHGVGGTSLQMIADALGVTKAAVYHQFKTKDAIVLAVAEVELSPLQDALDEATSRVDPDRARAVLLREVIDMAVERRRWVSALQGDPVMIRLLGEHPPFVELMTRVYALLMGEEAGPAVAVRTAIVSAAVGGAVVHPLLHDLDDDTLRAELLAVTQRLFDLPD
jgi:AcrR family transcriptional regulator